MLPEKFAKLVEEHERAYGENRRFSEMGAPSDVIIDIQSLVSARKDTDEEKFLIKIPKKPKS